MEVQNKALKIKQLGLPDLHKIVKYIAFISGEKKLAVHEHLLYPVRYYNVPELEWIRRLFRLVEKKGYVLTNWGVPYPIEKTEIENLYRYNNLINQINYQNKLKL